LVKINRNTRRSFVTTAVIIAVAVTGLFLLSSDGGQADQSASATSTADDPATTGTTDRLLSDSPLPALAKMVGALLVVIVCIYVGIYLLKRTVGTRYRNSRGTNALEVIETTGLGQRQSITLVRVGEKSVLVGVTENRMTLLSELDADDTATILATAPEELENDGFGRMLSAAAGGVRKLATKNRRTALET
jgi:flagellar biosynthetic protein FliO